MSETESKMSNPVVKEGDGEGPAYKDNDDVHDQAVSDDQKMADAGLKKAIETYKKVIENDGISEEDVQKNIKEIQDREIIEANTDHTPEEIPAEKGKISIGPPILTRFEKARIMGARALQLSLGAPPFIDIPASARTSLDIAMDELERRIIPIVIKRVLPNGDYQNIPIDHFKLE